MTSEADLIKGVRSATKVYLSVVSSRLHLILWALRKCRDSNGTLPTADGLYYWWEAFIHPDDPGLPRAFSKSEVAAITSYHQRILSFHQSDPSKDLSVFSFAISAAYGAIGNEARECLQVLNDGS